MSSEQKDLTQCLNSQLTFTFKNQLYCSSGHIHTEFIDSDISIDFKVGGGAKKPWSVSKKNKFIYLVYRLYGINV